jgi:FAD/FMN-containing dehydrogenase
MMVLATHNLVHDKLKSIVGAENVTDNEIILDAYMGTTTASAAVGQDRMTEYRREKVKEHRPGFVVRAGSKEEVQEIVRLANQHKIPIIPVAAFTSTYYETTPEEGCIMLDMRRMKGIEIDEDIMTVTFEPGVTWAQAFRDLAVKGYWVSAQASPASLQILGATSQAGMHLPMNKHAVNNSTYYSDLTIGAEIVLPTGELLVVGSASLPGTKPQAHRAYGPALGHIFLGSQGTLGIVVKHTLPLWRIPESRVIVQGNFKHQNFKGLANAMHKIMDDQNHGISWAERVWAVYEGDGTGATGEWEFYVLIFGSNELVDFLREWSEKIIVDEGGKLISPTRHYDPETDYSPQMYEEFIYWRGRANSIVQYPPDLGNLGVGGATTYDKIAELHDAAMKVLAKHGIPWSKIRKGMAMAPIRNATYLNVGLSYLYDKKNPEEVKRANAILEEWGPILYKLTGGKRIGFYAMSEASGGKEVVVYRMTPTAAKTQMPMLGEYYQLLKKLKRMLDPNHIMNPGKFMDIEPY